MADIVERETRSRMMSGIKGKDTAPEMQVRRFLHSLGFRYRLHVKDLPGRPDIVLPRYRTVIFVHGCFWHWHECRYFKLPATRTEFWKRKLMANRQRDEMNAGQIKLMGWKVLVIHECDLRDVPGKTLLNLKKQIRAGGHF